MPNIAVRFLPLAESRHPQRRPHSIPEIRQMIRIHETKFFHSRSNPSAGPNHSVPLLPIVQFQRYHVIPAAVPTGLSSHRDFHRSHEITTAPTGPPSYTPLITARLFALKTAVHRHLCSLHTLDTTVPNFDEDHPISAISTSHLTS